MSPVEWIAVGLSVLVLAETAWLILAPGSVVSLSKSVARHPYKLMALYSVLSLVFLYWLLGSMSLMEIVAGGVVIMLLYGVALLPFYDRVVDAFEEDYERGAVWSRLWPGLLVWILLAIAVLVEWTTSTTLF